MRTRTILGADERGRAYRPDPAAWDARVESWEAVAATPVFERLAARVLALADPRPGDVAVDLGCGTGLLALPLAAVAARTYAVDSSAQMLERLRQRAGEMGAAALEPVHADLRELPLEDESATLVVSNYAFHHLPDTGKELALSEARRVLRPGGRLVVCDMMFTLSLAPRDRTIVAEKIGTMIRKGPAGLLRVGKNAVRLAAGRWEHPSSPERWVSMLEGRRFDAVRIETVEHEAGIAWARKPLGGLA